MLISDRQIVAIRTYTGKQIMQWSGKDQVSLGWSREYQQTSTCQLAAASTLRYGAVPPIYPWLHWVDVWSEDGRSLYWTGPIQKFTANRTQMTVVAADLTALFKRTRNQLSKAWDATDPAFVAAEHMASMIEFHGLDVAAIVAANPFGDVYDITSIADSEMLDQTFNNLVQQGLGWTVNAGIPVLGPLPRTPIVSFGESHFVGDVTLVRDGTQIFNDVLVKGPENLANAIAPYGGLRLQTIQTIDNMFAVSNVNRAAQQLAYYDGVVRDSLDLSNGAVLHPQAPITIEQLVPSSRFVVDIYGLLLTTELTKVTVDASSTQTQVNVTLVTVDDELPELITLSQKNSINGLSSEFPT